jgi:hypothetical protein
MNFGTGHSDMFMFLKSWIQFMSNPCMAGHAEKCSFSLGQSWAEKRIESGKGFRLLLPENPLVHLAKS